MSLSTILFSATASAANVLKCSDPEKAFDPNFTLEIMHLQDITKGNEQDIAEIGNTYSYIIDELVATLPGKIKYGYAEFSDDASPAGDSKYANYKCMNIKRPLSVIEAGVDIFMQAISVATVDNYDMYNCGFKARTLAMNTKPGSLVNWSNDEGSFRILTMATDAPGKMGYDRLGCPTTQEFQNCPMAWALSSFDETKMGDATNLPTEDDLWRLGDDNRVNMAFIDLVKHSDKKTTSGLDANDWWTVFGMDQMSKAYNINVIDDFSVGGDLAQIIYANVLEAACFDKGQMYMGTPPPQAAPPGQGAGNGMR